MYLWFQSHLLAAVGVMPDNDHNEKLSTFVAGRAQPVLEERT